SLAAFYMLGAMRLWSGEPPMLLEPMLRHKSFKWGPRSLMIFAAALWGHVSPRTLKGFLRGSIRVRDLLASIKVKDGEPYEWRSKYPSPAWASAVRTGYARSKLHRHSSWPRVLTSILLHSSERPQGLAFPPIAVSPIWRKPWTLTDLRP